jgi:hypothetical protein
MIRSEFNELKVGDIVWISGRAKERGESATITSLINEWGYIDIRFVDGHERTISYTSLTINPPTYKEPVIEVHIDEFNDILYHLEDFMGCMGYGGEYNKIVNLVKKLPLKGKDLSAFPRINRIVNPIQTHDIMFPMFKE